MKEQVQMELASVRSIVGSFHQTFQIKDFCLEHMDCVD